MPPAPPCDDAPLLVVTDVAARLVRRGLLAPADAEGGEWRRARVLVFRRGPVRCEPPAGSWPPGVHCDLLARRAR